MRISISTFVLFFCMLFACKNKPQKAPTYNRDLTSVEVGKMDKNSFTFIDVRTAEEIAAGSITGAKFMDFHSDGFESALQQLDKNQTYVIYCQSGGRSSKTCDLMNKNGFKKIYNLKGGYTEWNKN